MTNQNIILSVPDMHCTSCPKLINMTLSEMDGVIQVNSSLDTKTVTVNINPDITTPQLLIEAIKEIGYTAHTQN